VFAERTSARPSKELQRVEHERELYTLGPLGTHVVHLTHSSLVGDMRALAPAVRLEAASGSVALTFPW
jgi:hypothetical protein